MNVLKNDFSIPVTRAETFYRSAKTNAISISKDFGPYRNVFPIKGEKSNSYKNN